MKIETFYLALSLPILQNCQSEKVTKRVPANYTLPYYIAGQRCIEGKLIFFAENNSITNTKNYTYLDCHTLAPRCGFRLETWTIPETVSRLGIIHFGCFPARETKRIEELVLHESNSAIAMRDINEIIHHFSYFHYFSAVLTYLTDYRPTEEQLKDDTYSYENNWVENPDTRIFDLMNDKCRMSYRRGGFCNYFSQSDISPLMMLYIIFICFSVLFKLIWLVKVAYKHMKQGYEPMERTEPTEDFQRTVDEMT